eukprot:GHVP01029572.1.p2 GENE.GHVP01029572.1~~GHVP01029572.1.p2  ORF type:complete len:218 (-),score=53.68 GHVP01029572.1:64-717(-)
MTTAHRPTFFSVQGGNDQGGNRLVVPTTKVSARDLPSNKVLKLRKLGQSSIEELGVKEVQLQLLELEAKEGREIIRNNFVDNVSGPVKVAEDDRPFPQDADDSPGEDSAEFEYEDSESDDEDSQLMRELELIKKERRLEVERLAALQDQKEKEKDKLGIMKDNPIIAADVTIRKAWDQDTVFKNQAKDLERKSDNKTFINDAVRSEFHKKFMQKYIK